MIATKRRVFGISLFIWMIFFGAVLPVHAGTNTMVQLLKILHDKGTIDTATYNLLKESALADEKVTVKQASELKEAVNKIKKDDVTVSTSDGHLKFETDDGAFKLQLGGRIMVDGAWYDSDQQSIGNGTEIRRARVFTKGTVWNDWHFKASYEFSGDAGRIRDAYIEYSGLGQYLPVPLTVKVGNFFEPFGLELHTSSKYLTFMERALPNVFVPGRNLVFSLSSHGENWTTSMGLFGSGIDNENDDGDESHAFATRTTFAPLYEKNRSVHLGGAFEYRKLKGDDVRIRVSPESRISTVRLVDVNIPEAKDSRTWSAEVATVIGPFSAQAEYIDVSYDSRFLSDIDFSGWYTYASWFLTGESRVYKPSQGTFSRVKPNGIVGKGGYGAWELAVRYSEIDLNDGFLRGGREDNVTLGLNWYATPTIRFMANYIFADSKRNGINDDPQIFQLRSQIDF